MRSAAVNARRALLPKSACYGVALTCINLALTLTWNDERAMYKYVIINKKLAR